MIVAEVRLRFEDEVEKERKKHTGILEIALNCFPTPVFNWIFEKVFTPLPPDQDHVVDQAMVSPDREVIEEHWDPVAPLIPHWSRKSS